MIANPKQFSDTFSQDINRRYVIVALTVMTLVGFILRVIGSYEIIPYVSDPQIVNEALRLGQLVAERDISVLSQAFKYPLILPYLLSACYGALFVVGRLVGTFGSIAEYQAYLFANVTLYHLIAALVVAVMNTALIPIIYLLGRSIYDKRIGLLAAALLTVGLLNVQLAHQARPHAAVTFMLAATLLAATYLLRAGSLRWYLLTGTLAGISAGILHNGFFAFAFFIVAHIAYWWREGSKRNHSIVDRNLILGLLVGGIVVLLAYPQIILSPDQILRLESDGQLILSGNHDLRSNFWDPARLTDRAITLFQYEPVIFVFGICGLLYGLWIARTRWLHLIVMVFIVFYFLLFAPLADAEARFFTPLPPFLSLTAAHIVVDFFDRLRAGKTVVLVGAVILLIPGLVMSLRLNWLFTRTDTRVLATEWISENLAPGSALLQSVDLAIPPSRASLMRQVERFPGSLGARDEWLLTLPMTEYPQPNFDLYRLWVYNPYSSDELIELLQDHEMVWSAFVSRTLFPRDDWPYNYASSHAAQVQEFSPIRNVARFGDAALPGDMSRPLRDLWSVQRMGPIVELFELTVQ